MSENTPKMRAITRVANITQKQADALIRSARKAAEQAARIAELEAALRLATKSTHWVNCSCLHCEEFRQAHSVLNASPKG